MQTVNPAKPKLVTLQIITGVLCAGISLFLAVFLFLNRDKSISLMPSSENKSLVYTAAAFAAGCVLFSFKRFHDMLSQIDLTLPVSSRLIRYQTAYIARYALLEGSALFNVVVFFLHRCLINLIVALVILAIMLLLIPKRSKANEDLKINYPDVLE